VLRETTSRGLCGLVGPSRTSERGREGDCVKEGGGGAGKCVTKCERERALDLHDATSLDIEGSSPFVCFTRSTQVCVFYYCRTFYKAVRVGGGGEWRTCAMREDEPRSVWMSLIITH
jgi:hypothetical protein